LLSADGDCRCAGASVATLHTTVAAIQAASHQTPVRLPTNLIDVLAAFLV
jgi:acyl-CoA thioesterase FadM